MIWIVALLIVLPSIGTGAVARFQGAVVIAFLHVVSGLLFRTARSQGLWLEPDGKVRLCSPLGDWVLPKTEVERVLLDRGLGSALVWARGRWWWLETGSRLGLGVPPVEVLHQRAAQIADHASCDVAVVEDFESLRGQPISSLEFSFRGFPRVIRSPWVLSSVVIGQLVLLASIA